MESRRVHFPAASGQQLAARLDLPDATPATSFALLAHCFTCGKDFKALYYLARALTRAGIACLRLDFTGIGESGGAFGASGLHTNVADLCAAAAYLEGNFAGPSLLVGHSLGGTAALLAAPRIDTVAAVVTIATPADIRHLEGLAAEARREGRLTVAGRQYPAGEQFFADLSAVDPLGAAAALGRPLLVVHSEADELLDPTHGERLFAAARPPKGLVVLAGADHQLSHGPDAERLGEVLAGWARSHSPR